MPHAQKLDSDDFAFFTERAAETAVMCNITHSYACYIWCALFSALASQAYDWHSKNSIVKVVGFVDFWKLSLFFLTNVKGIFQWTCNTCIHCIGESCLHPSNFQSQKVSTKVCFVHMCKWTPIKGQCHVICFVVVDGSDAVNQIDHD